MFFLSFDIITRVILEVLLYSRGENYTRMSVIVCECVCVRVCVSVCTRTWVRVTCSGECSHFQSIKTAGRSHYCLLFNVLSLLDTLSLFLLLSAAGTKRGTRWHLLQGHGISLTPGFWAPGHPWDDSESVSFQTHQQSDTRHEQSLCLIVLDELDKQSERFFFPLSLEGLFCLFAREGGFFCLFLSSLSNGLPLWVVHLLSFHSPSLPPSLPLSHSHTLSLSHTPSLPQPFRNGFSIHGKIILAGIILFLSLIKKYS